MFKWIAAGALVLSIAFCAAAEFVARQKLEDRRAQIATLQGEQQPVLKYVREVEDFQRQKDALQKRIDIINQLKQNQQGPAIAVAKLANADPSSIDSVAVVNNQELVVNRR